MRFFRQEQDALFSKAFRAELTLISVVDIWFLKTMLIQEFALINQPQYEENFPE